MNSFYNDHTFAVLAYKESAYLEECIQSLLNQEIKSNIRIFTSTPNTHIQKISAKYGVELSINNNGGSIAKDWNFALLSSTTTWVTLAHQDDVYFKDFLKETSSRFLHDNALIFTNYRHIKNDVVVSGGLLIFVKVLLLLPFVFSEKIGSGALKKLTLLFGSPFCCPSATYNKSMLKDFKFDESLKVSLDWEAWYRIAQSNGAIIYLKKAFMAHRIHEESETTNMISENIRAKEDRMMFEKIWGRFLGSFWARFYSLSYKLN